MVMSLMGVSVVGMPNAGKGVDFEVANNPGEKYAMASAGVRVTPKVWFQF
jgi:hypothetical protein